MNKKNLSAILFNFGVLLVGICLILWADKVTNLVSIALGCLICLYGIINIVSYFKVKDKKDNFKTIFRKKSTIFTKRRKIWSCNCKSNR